jgi:hypothetical protein
MALDRQLDEAINALPPLLRMPDISELVTDPAEQLMCRFNLDLLALKTRIVLHRRYMETPFAELTPFEQQRGIGLNRQKAVDAAVKVLRHHHTIYSATQPGGQLESVKWYMGSISTHDFLLAAMVICLELSQQIGPNAETLNKPGTRCPFRDPMMEALEKSYDIWAKSSRKRKFKQVHGTGHVFDETEKASRAMAAMLKKVKRAPVQTGAAIPAVIGCGHVANEGNKSGAINNDQLAPESFEQNQIPSTTAFGGLSLIDILPPDHAAWDTPLRPDFELLIDSYPTNKKSSSGPTSPHRNAVPQTTNISPDSYQPFDPSATNMDDLTPDVGMDFDMIDAMLSMPSTLDWDMFDQGVINTAPVISGGGTGGPIQSQMSGGVQITTNGGPSLADGRYTEDDFDLFPMAAGNAMVGGGTGPGSGWAFDGGSGWAMEAQQ